AGCDARALPSRAHRGSASEVDGGTCTDADGNGLVDAADPVCQAQGFPLRGTIFLPATRARLRLAGRLPDLPAPGAASLLIADAQGAVLCGALGAFVPANRGTLVAQGVLATGPVTVKVKLDGSVGIRAKGLALPALDDPQLTIGLGVGAERYVASAGFRARGRSRWVNP